MRKSQSSEMEEESSIDITPMLDIVFIMLIFFIVTATFVKETGVDVNRPEASTAEKKERANILIAIDSRDRIFMDKREIDPRAVRANIQRMRAESPEGSVVIQADSESRHEVLVLVIDAARQAGIFNVAIASEID
ncbi:MAG: biopolymer transporter ExbD [Gammaproteobacteria bacterium]|nr:biopolymer transporter ExbD [Pseudomonadota bacterium]MCH9663552.1 biopolymer transporter ExbD [Gammaproteobacteria bacterium]